MAHSMLMDDPDDKANDPFDPELTLENPSPQHTSESTHKREQKASHRLSRLISITGKSPAKLKQT